MHRGLACILAFVAAVRGSILDGDLALTDGVKLVSIPVSNSLEEEGRALGEDSALYRLAKFLEGHELHIKLPYLIEKEKVTQIFSESLKAVDESTKENDVTGRRRHGGGGGGGGSVALLGLMFAKGLGALGIGGLGLLTMKALAASALALMMSAIVGVKKLSSHDDHDDHQVIYADHGHHHRRKRHAEDVPLPYRGWVGYSQNVPH